MSCKHWLLLGSLALSAAPTVACSSKFSSCEARRTCASGGTSGTAGAAGASTDGGEAGAAEGGSAGADAQAGTAGTADDAGSGGTAGESNVDTELTIASPKLTAGKTYVPFTGKLSASGAAQYTWSLTSGTLPAGLALQDAESATLTIAGTASEAGQFPITVSVTDGSITKSVDVTLVVTHSALFLSDRNTAGVNELFLSEIGGETAATPVRLSASLPAGGSVTSYAWSPDGSKVLYLATQSAGGAAELWVASVAAPGTAQRVSAVGDAVSLMVWLKAGKVAAYITSAGNAYLVDLSNPTPGTSKLVVQGPAVPAALVPSPNGTSVTIGVVRTEAGSQLGFATVTYVTWAPGAPKTVDVFTSAYSDSFLNLSYDGRFGIASRSGSYYYWDLLPASPTSGSVGAGGSGRLVWSPNAEALLIHSGTGSPSSSLSIGIFDSGGGLTSTVLVLGCAPFPGAWSPDGKNVLFGCESDLRAISNVSPAATGTDFSLLSSGFFSNAFTNVPNVSWSPDSTWIALSANRDVDARFDLQLLRWSAPGILYKPHANSTGSGVTTWAFAQNSHSLAFVGSIAPQTSAGLYLTKLPATGAPSTATLISRPASAVVQTDINWLPGSRVLAYRATVSGAAQLFALPVAADGTAGTPVSISGPSGSGVTSYQLAPTR